MVCENEPPANTARKNKNKYLRYMEPKIIFRSHLKNTYWLILLRLFHSFVAFLAKRSLNY